MYVGLLRTKMENDPSSHGISNMLELSSRSICWPVFWDAWHLLHCIWESGFQFTESVCEFLKSVVCYGHDSPVNMGMEGKWVVTVSSGRLVQHSDRPPTPPFGPSAHNGPVQAALLQLRLQGPRNLIRHE